MNFKWMKARAVSGMASLLLALTVSGTALAQEPALDAGRDEGYAIFVSQRNGAAELYLLDLNTRQVSQLTNTGRGHLAPSIANNRAIVFAAREGANYELFSGTLSASWRSRRPAILSLNRLTVDTEDQLTPTVAGDGGYMVFQSTSGIELMTVGGAGKQLLIPASKDHRDFAPAISPDGTQVAFVSDRSGAHEIWLYTRAGGSLRQLTRSADVLGGLSWSADGKRLVFNTKATSSQLSGIALADVESGGFRVVTESNDFNGSLSARGDRMLFTSTRDGDAELYLLRVSTGTVERLTNNLGLDDGAVFVSDTVRPARPTR